MILLVRFDGHATSEKIIYLLVKTQQISVLLLLVCMHVSFLAVCFSLQNLNNFYLHSE